MHRERERQRETERETDRQTDRETDRQTERERKRKRERYRQLAIIMLRLSGQHFTHNGCLSVGLIKWPLFSSTVSAWFLNVEKIIHLD